MEILSGKRFEGVGIKGIRAAVEDYRYGKTVQIEGDFISFLDVYGSIVYEIPLNQTKTLEEILKWSVHMSRKTWSTTESLREFIDISCEAIGVDVSTV